jgi:hypothetical protein
MTRPSQSANTGPKLRLGREPIPVRPSGKLLARLVGSPDPTIDIVPLGEKTFTERQQSAVRGTSLALGWDDTDDAESH